NIAAAVRLTGALRVDLLRRAASEIARRQQSLRTIFTGAHDEPAQVIQPPRAVPLPLIDLRAVPERERIASRLAQEEAHRSFDLSRGPLARGTLLRLGADEHVLVWVVHHIVADGGSVEVLIRELTLLYGALHRGVPAPLPDLPVQVRDFAVWQRRLLQGDTLAELRSYWQRRLAGAPPLLRLAADRPRPARQSFRGARLAASFSPELGGRVAALAEREQCTIFMTLLGAFAAVLHHGSNQQDLVVGAPFGSRPRPELEGLIGLFVNVLPLRLELSGDPTFRELLARVRREVLGALAHQHMPFEKLVEDLRPERDASYNPLFQVTFNVLEGDLAQPLAMPGVTVTAFPFARELTQFDLSLTVNRRGHDLTATFQYSTDLFDELTVAWMGEDLQSALALVTAEPETRLSRLRAVLDAAAEQRRAALAKQLQHADRESFGLRRRQAVSVLEAVREV
ncbi:MAG: non-ribosomal peptide synthetase, partial [Acidobacteria bacterium]|nr:non-ribosomal peptide synthetase [Acidobacteriota bacterium]